MQSDNRFLDDLAKLATGAAGAVTSARAEAESALRAWLDRRLNELDLVSREEFEAVRDMAVQAREESARLAQRVEALEAELAEIRASGSTSAPQKATSGGSGAAKGGSSKKSNGPRSSS